MRKRNNVPEVSRTEKEFERRQNHTYCIGVLAGIKQAAG